MDFTTLMLYISAGAILLWLVVLRPAQRQERERKALLSQLKINDEVLTSSGIIGNVVKIKEKAGGAAGDEDVITLRVDDKTRIQVVRSSIARVHRASDDKADEKKEPDPKTNS
jgi:preprotein translocase subunit YajC